MQVQSSAPHRGIDQIPVGHPAVSQIFTGNLVGCRQPSDYALARDAALGVMTALAKLYERHERRVYGVCLSMTRNPAQAEDLTQDVFIHLISKIASFRGESKFSTWLHRLTVNRVLMHFRRKDVRRAAVCDELKEETFQRPRTHKSSSAQMVERIALHSALKQLPLGCRSVFLLFEIGGYKHDEIAQLLGCSSGTSKSQLHRARMKLRGLLG
jgi:RNA polymerase sigma-70 factor (ECF subfamily)